jgi:hypothetical protein
MKVADAPDVILKNKIYTLLKKKRKKVVAWLIIANRFRQGKFHKT